MKKKFFSILAKITIFVMVLSLSFVTAVPGTGAAEVTDEQDIMTRLQVSTASDHDIRFVTPSGAGDATDTITITFASEFDTALIGEDDVDLAYSNDATCTSFPNELETASSASATEWGVSMASDVLTLTHPTDDAAGDIPANRCVQIQIGTNATYDGTGLNQIVNPSSAGTYTITIAGTFGDNGAIAVAILSDDQVDVTATVDPTFTFSISTTSCALGTLSTGSISTCSYTVTTSTNADDGYTTTIVENYELRKGTAGASDEIAEVTDGTINAGTEEYGAGTSMAGQDIAQEATCTGPTISASALSTTPQSVASATGPVSNSQATICHGASIDASTEPGNYEHTVTLISTGVF